MNSNFSKRYDISKSPVDGKYRVYEWMTLSDITSDNDRDCYKKMICIGVVNTEEECLEIINSRSKKD